jgi:uncharacterized membrane protein required for colicin V production
MDNAAPAQRGFSIWLLLMGAVGAVVGFSWSEKDYVTASALGVVAFCGLWGYFFGAMRILGGVGGIVAAYHFAPRTALWIAAHLPDSVSTSPWMTQTLSLGVASLGIAALVMCIARIVSRRCSQSHDCFDSGNQVLGLGLGAAQGAVSMLFLLSAAVTSAPLANERLQQPTSAGHEVLSRIAAQQIVDIAHQTQRSTIAPLIERYNPFEHVPQLKQMQRTVAAIQDPQVFARFAEHPAMTKLQNKPSVRAAMESLANDSELKELALSGKTITAQTALSLLDNPAIAKLLTEPELIRDIAQALREFDQDELNSLASCHSLSKPCVAKGTHGSQSKPCVGKGG